MRSEGRSEGYGTWFVSVSVCPSVRLLFVTTFSTTTRNETTNSDTNRFITTLASF